MTAVTYLPASVSFAIDMIFSFICCSCVKTVKRMRFLDKRSKEPTFVINMHMSKIHI